MADVPVEVTFAVAIVSGLIGWGGVSLGHAMTRRREDRSRQIQQKREAYVGALGAWRDYVAQETEIRVIAERVSEQVTVAETVANNVKTVQARTAAASPKWPPELRQTIQAIVDRGFDLADDVRSHARSHGDDLVRRNAAMQATAVGLNYWLSMLDVTCSREVTAAYKALCEATQEQRPERIGAYADAFKAEMERMQANQTFFEWLFSDD